MFRKILALFKKKERENLNPCWLCRGELVWQQDFMKDEWGMEGEGMIAILRCMDCKAEVRVIEEDEP